MTSMLSNSGVAGTRKDASKTGEGWDLCRSAPLPTDTLTAAILRYKQTGCVEARNRVVETHLRLVAKICRRHSRRGASFDDLMAEGALALMRAVDGFDPERGVSFTSYATAVVEHAVRGAARDGHSTVKVPSRERRRLAQRYKAESTFFAEHGRWPTAPDFAGAAPSGRSTQPTLASGMEVSLDGDSEQRASISSVLADGRPLPVDEVAAVDTVSSLRGALERLTPVGAEVIRLRFGLGGSPRLSPRDCARRLGLTDRALHSQLEGALRVLRQAVRTDPRA
jgi:RNA polymerase sigma factor (sigma-70 family)